MPNTDRPAWNAYATTVEMLDAADADDRAAERAYAAFATDADRCDCNRFAPRPCAIHDALDRDIRDAFATTAARDDIARATAAAHVPEWRRRALADHASRGFVATHALDRS